jgi:glycosyltransferase involved in cell wall biosynthesis
LRILIDGLSARVGGGLTYLRYMLPALVSEAPQHRFRVLLSPRYQADVLSHAPDGLELERADLPAGQIWRRFLYLRRELPLIVKRESIDAVFAVAESAYPPLPCPLVVMARNPTLYRATGEVPGSGLKWKIHRWSRAAMIYPTLRRARVVVFVSDTFRNAVVGDLRLDVSRTTVVHHGVSPGFHAAGAPGRAERDAGVGFVLAVSSIGAHKNYEVLLKAFAMLRKDFAGLRLEVAGRVLERRMFLSLQDLAASLGIERQVEFLGEVDHDRLSRLYREASIFVMPSKQETFGNPLVEAMASGTPVIASDLAACREVCADAAIYFSPSDPVALAEKLRAVLIEPSLREELSRRGLARSQEYSWQKAARSIIRILEEATSSSRPGAVDHAVAKVRE